MFDCNIALFNKLIEELIAHGGDAGGAYYSNEEGVRNAMQAIAVNSGLVWAFDAYGNPIVLRKQRKNEKCGEV